MIKYLKGVVWTIQRNENSGFVGKVVVRGTDSVSLFGDAGVPMFTRKCDNRTGNGICMRQASGFGVAVI